MALLSKKEKLELAEIIANAVVTALKENSSNSQPSTEGRKSANEGTSSASQKKTSTKKSTTSKLTIADFEPKGSKMNGGYTNWASYKAQRTKYCYFVATNGEVVDGKVTIKRRIESGVETVKAPLPLVVTVNGSADECRPRNAKAIQKYKYAAVPSEVAEDEAKKALIEKRPYLAIGEWNAAYVDADLEQCGLNGSPTKVKSIENVVFTAKEARCVGNNDQELEDLIKELIVNHTIG